jgi:hypothetical protein
MRFLTLRAVLAFAALAIGPLLQLGSSANAGPISIVASEPIEPQLVFPHFTFQKAEFPLIIDTWNAELDPSIQDAPANDNPNFVSAPPGPAPFSIYLNHCGNRGVSNEPAGLPTLSSPSSGSVPISVDYRADFHLPQISGFCLISTRNQLPDPQPYDLFRPPR